MDRRKKLVNSFSFELAEDHHSPTSGRYGLRVVLDDDISQCLPYLNSVIDSSLYDRADNILIGAKDGIQYAFRPLEVRIGILEDPSSAEMTASEAVNLINRTWEERDDIAPDYRQRRLPPIYEIYRLLPGDNCKACGYATCLAFASAVRSKEVAPDVCPALSKPEFTESRQSILHLFQ